MGRTGTNIGSVFMANRKLINRCWLLGAVLMAGCAPSLHPDSDDCLLRPHRCEGHFADGTSYEVLVVESSYLGDATDWWGTDGSIPRFVVLFAGVMLGNECIVLPLECIKDLAEVSDLKMEEKDGKPLLTIRGGDAAGSYLAHFTFMPDAICRYVEHGEVGEEISEKARWDRKGKLIDRSVRNDYVK